MNNVIFSSFRDKFKYLIYIILIVIICIFYFIILAIINFYTYNINNTIRNYKENREIYVNNCDTNFPSVVMKLKNIEEYYPLYTNFSGKNNGHEVSVNVFHNDEIIMGRELINDNEVIISKFYYNILGLSTDDIVNKREINIVLNHQNLNFNIVGVTSNNKINILMSTKIFEKITAVKPYQYYVLVDEYKNVDIVRNKLFELNYNSELYESSGYLEIKKTESTQMIFRYILRVCK